jgi:hypothetical protein
MNVKGFSVSFRKNRLSQTSLRLQNFYTVPIPAYSSRMMAKIIEPSFGRSVIDTKKSDGYWVETFQFSNQEPVPGIIAYETSSPVASNVDLDIDLALYRAMLNSWIIP